MLNYLKGFVGKVESPNTEYEFIYIYYSSSYKHVKIGRSINYKTLKGRYSTYKTQDNAAMMIAYETKMCNTIEEYLRERVLPTFRLNGNQSKKTDECYNISVIAAKYAISYTIAKIEYQLSVDTSITLNPEIIYCLCTYSKDEPETLTYNEDKRITVVSYKEILSPIVDMTTVIESFTELEIDNSRKKRQSVNKSLSKVVDSESTDSDSESVEPKPQDCIQSFVSEHICKCEDGCETMDDIYNAYCKYIDKMKESNIVHVYNPGRSSFSPRFKSILGIDKLTRIKSKPCIIGYKLR